MTSTETAKTFVLDTNVLIHDPEALFKFQDNHLLVPIFVIEELDGLKKGANEVGRNARYTLRLLDALDAEGKIGSPSETRTAFVNDSKGTLEIVLSSPLYRDSIPQDLDWDKKDNKIIAVAVANEAILVTKDTNVRVKARAIGVKTADYETDKVNYDGLYTGHSEAFISENDLNLLYSEGFATKNQVNLHDCPPNEYVTFYSTDNPKHSAIARYDAFNEIFVLVSGSTMKPAGLMPKNSEQLMAIDALMNPDIKLVTLVGVAGTGKAQPLDAKVLTPTGYVEMGSLKVGDLVVTPGGDYAPILEVFPQGNKEIFKVEFSDGTSTECCNDHLWEVRNTTDRALHRDPRVLPLSELRGKVLMSEGTPRERRNWSIDMVSPNIDLLGTSLPIPPYVLGAILGDGGMSQSFVTMTSADPFIIEKIQSQLSRINIKLGKRAGIYEHLFTCKRMSRNNGVPIERYTDAGETKLYQRGEDIIADGFCISSVYRVIQGKYSRHKGFKWRHKDCLKNYSTNYIISGLASLGLMGMLSVDKHVPEKYKITSASNRLSLLQGLMDTDGFVSEDGTSTVFYSSSASLASDVLFIVESLGGKATLKDKQTYYSHKGERKTGKPSYAVHISMPPEICPFTLPRKVDRYRPRSKYPPTRYISAITSVGYKKAQCILINHPSHLYITNNFIVTHNTLCALAAAIQGVDDHEYSKALVARPVVPMGNDVGYLPGSLEEKLGPWMAPIRDSVDFLMGTALSHKKEPKKETKEPKKSSKASKPGKVVKELERDYYEKDAGKLPGVDELVAHGMMELCTLTFMRGRSIPNQFIVVDEVQNCSPHEIKTLITRAGEGTKIVLTGDPDQIDTPYLDASSNGLTYVVEKFRGEGIAAHVTLTKGERSELAEIAAKVL